MKKIMFDKKKTKDKYCYSIIIEDSQLDLRKIWIEQVLLSVSKPTKQKIKLLMWIMENLREGNLLIATQREMAKKSHLSLKTIADTVKELAEDGLITILRSGVYEVKEELVLRGNEISKMQINIEYVSRNYKEYIQQGLDGEDKEEIAIDTVNGGVLKKKINKEQTPKKTEKTKKAKTSTKSTKTKTTRKTKNDTKINKKVDSI